MPMKGLLKSSFLIAGALVGAISFAHAQTRSMLDGTFNLKAAILSPAPLGPPSQFEPRAAIPEPEPALTAAPASKAAEATLERAAPHEIAARKPHKIASSRPRQKSAVATRKPRSNPLESYATDTRRQTWPCTGGGGICAWAR